MNNVYKQEIRYKILKILAAEPNLSQRDMAAKMGISLGKTNYVLSELAEKGIIKIRRFRNAQQKLSYSYILTPHGLEQKARITWHFLRNKLSEYKAIKAQIREIVSDLQADPTADILGPDTVKILADDCQDCR